MQHVLISPMVEGLGNDSAMLGSGSDMPHVIGAGKWASDLWDAVAVIARPAIQNEWTEYFLRENLEV